MKVQQGNNARDNKGGDLKQREVRRFVALFSRSSFQVTGKKKVQLTLKIILWRNLWGAIFKANTKENRVPSQCFNAVTPVSSFQCLHTLCVPTAPLEPLLLNHFGQHLPPEVETTCLLWFWWSLFSWLTYPLWGHTGLSSGSSGELLLSGSATRAYKVN